MTPTRVKTLWIRPEYLGQILSGVKTVEVRVGYDNIRRLQSGDELRLNGQHQYRIVRTAHYTSFEEMLELEDAETIAPGLSSTELLARCRELYPPDKEALGVVVLELEPKIGEEEEATCS